MEIKNENKVLTQEDILTSKEIRDKAVEHIEVLDKVKQLVLLPELECMTIKQMADYYEVPFKTIDSQYNYNKDEFDNDGVHLKRLNEFKSLVALNSSNLKVAQRRGFLELTLPDGTIVAINNKGVKCFPKRAVLRMGMLLRDSRVAKEVRTQLLNTFEHATEEQRTAAITEEENLMGDVVRSLVDGDIMETATALARFVDHKNRYIAAIEQYNAHLAAEIKQNKPKTEFYDTVAESKGLADMAQMAKICGNEGITNANGKHLGRNGLFSWLRENKYLRDNNEPYQQYVDIGYFVVKEYSYRKNGASCIGFKTYITGKGQQYILRKLKESFCDV